MRRSSLLTVGLTLLLAAGCTQDSADPASPITPPDRPRDVAPMEPPGREPLAPEAALSSEGGVLANDVELPDLELIELVTLATPIDTTVLPDGTVLVAERAGRVRELHGETPGRVVLDLTGRTTTQSERGLLAIEVAPWGDELFVSLTDLAGNTLVEAYPLDGAMVSGPPREIYATDQPFPNHNGGAILFLPDDTLLIGLGDGGGSGDPLGAGQDVSTPLGAVLRLNVRAQPFAPDDNPFVNQHGAVREIAAIGLRNPWRMAFDPFRDELWIADVGQSSREEINRVALDEFLGANFGWALREGNARFLGDEPEGHVRPLFDYEHGPGCSVTGGLVYRGTDVPGLSGGYVFSDFCEGEIRVLRRDSAGLLVAQGLGVHATRVIGFGTDARGELLVLELGGRILRLTVAS